MHQIITHKHTTLPRVLVSIILVSFLLKILLVGFAVWNLGEQSLLTNDSSNFYRTAVNVAAGNGFTKDTTPPYTPEAHFPPGYPLAIAVSLKLFNSILPLIVLQLLLSSCIPIIVWKLAQHVSTHKRAHIIAVALAAFEPLMLLWGMLLLTEVFAVFFVLLALYYFVVWTEKPRARYTLYAGALLGLSTLIRPHAQFLMFVGLLALFLFGIYAYRKEKRLGVFTSLLVFFIAFTAVVTPWSLRNYLVFGTPSVSTTGLRNIYTSIGPAVLSLRDNIGFEEAQDKIYSSFEAEYGKSARDIQEDPSIGPLLAKEGIAIIRENPTETTQVLAIALNAFFTQDLYFDYLRRFHIVPFIPIGFSPSVMLVEDGPVKLGLRIWNTLGAYTLIPVIGRVFWITINILWIIGAILLFRHSTTHQRVTTAILVLVIFYYAATSSVAAFSDHGRFRYPVQPAMFILASSALTLLLDRKSVPTFNKMIHKRQDR